MKKGLRLLCLLAGLSFTLQVEALSPELESIKNQITAKEYEQAWQALITLQQEWEGDPEYDYLYALTAMHRGEEQRALFALERVIVNQPGWTQARYQLALAYYKVNNYQACLKETRKLSLNDNLAPKLANANALLQQAAEQKLTLQAISFSHLLGLNLGHDSNVNAGTAEESIFIPSLGTINLFSTSRESDDNYWGTRYALHINKPISQQESLKLSWDTNYTAFQDLDQYDRIISSLRANYEYRANHWRSSIGLHLVPLWLDSDYYRMQSALMASYEQDFGKNWSLSGQLMLGETDNNADERLNTDNLGSEFGAHYRLGSSKHSILLGFAQETSQDSANDHNSRHIASATYRMHWRMTSAWLWTFYLGYQQQNYQGNHPLFLAPRDENLLMTGTTIQYLFRSGFSLQLAAHHQKKDSNFELFSYDRTDLGLSMNYLF